MFIHGLVLEKYKALMHHDIKKISISDLSQMTIIDGPNGYGKSSILRELTPYPACRTDYEKGGCKTLEVSHEGVLYTLTSDFSKTGAHSFIRDGVELNKSGTTEVQDSLAHQYFGYLPIIDKLMSGVCQICDMSKPARKELIYSTYPSSLMFIMEHHKSLCSQMRVINNQLKLLNEKKFSLTDSMLPEATLKLYKEEQTLLNELNTKIDKQIFSLTDQIKDSPHSLSEDLDSIMDKIHIFQDKIYEIYTDKRVKFKSQKQLARHIGGLTSEARTCRSQLSELKEQGITIKEEIEAFNKILNTSEEDAIATCERLISVQRAIIDKFVPIKDMPVVGPTELESMHASAHKLQDELHILAGLDTKFLTEDEYRVLEREELLYQRQIADAQEDETRAINVIRTQQDKLNKLIAKGYPDDCSRVCQLKNNFDSVLDGVRQEIKSYTEILTKSRAIIKEVEPKLSVVKTTLQYGYTARPILAKLERFITSKHWGNYVCSDLTLLESVNTNLVNINNKYTEVIMYSTEYNKVEQAKHELSLLEAKLVGLKATHQPATDLLKTALNDKRNNLHKIVEKLKDLTIKVNELDLSTVIYTQQEQVYDEFHAFVTHFSSWQTQYLEYHKYIYTKEHIKHLEDYKTVISSALRNLDKVIREQDNYLVRLNDEILPDITRLTLKHKKLSAVADQLSPTSGIPYRYTVRYLNSVLMVANEFIRKIWSYDMELGYIEEDSPDKFDFSIKLMFNQSSDVKDISLGSKSQRSLINLVFRLAVCVYRAYTQSYPLKLDEIDDGFSPVHRDKLTSFLYELLHQNNITQALLVNHHESVNTNFVGSGLIVLDEEDNQMQQCIIRSKIG